jgi:HK97 family phage major capsid protein
MPQYEITTAAPGVLRLPAAARNGEAKSLTTRPTSERVQSPSPVGRVHFFTRHPGTTEGTVNETIQRLEAQIAGLIDQQEAALASAEAEGCSAEDRARHLANWDGLQAQITTARESLTRAQTSAASRATLVADRTQPARPAVNTGLHNPHAAIGARPTIPANVRRHANLQAFRGQDAEANAYRAGLWCLGTLFGHAGSRERYAELFGADDLRSAPAATTLNTANNGSGGYFVPDVMDYAVIELAETFGTFRQYAERVPMSSDTHRTPRWTGSMVAYYVAEGSGPTQSDPAWDMIENVVKNLAAKSKMTRNVSEDTVIDLAEKVAMAAAVAFSEAEDDAGWNGDGTSTYGGIVGVRTKLVQSANAASLFTATGHATLDALTIGDFDSVMGKLPEYPGIKPAWFMHKSVYYASMRRLMNATGGATPADVASGARLGLGGYPVVFAQKMPNATAVTTGVTGIVFGDLKMGVKFGDRRGRTFETGFENDDFTKQLITMLCTERYDINAHTIVDPRNTSNPGPIIGLKMG